MKKVRESRFLEDKPEVADLQVVDKVVVVENCFWKIAQAVERRGAFDGRRSGLKRVFCHAWNGHPETQGAVHNQAGTEVTEVQ